jgi:tetratricopeptide (TPR) repeat protein
MGRSGKLAIMTVLLLAAILPARTAICDETTSTKQEAEDLDFASGLLSRGMYDMAVSSYGDFLKKNPKSRYVEEARYMIAEIWFLQKDNEKALSEFQKFLRQGASPSFEADARLRIGQIKYALNDLGKAEEEFKEVKRSSHAGKETIEAAEYYIAEIFMKTGQNRKARKAFEDILEKDQKGQYSGFASMHLGDIYSEEKQFDRASEMYKIAGETFREQGFAEEARLREAEAFSLAGKTDISLEKYRGILNASSEEDIRSRAAFGIVSVNYSAGKNEAVIEEAKALLPEMKSKESICRVKFLLANTYLSANRFKEAIEVYGEISGKCLSPRIERRAKLNNCWALYQLGEHDKSLEEAGKYLAAYPGEDADEALYLRAKTYGAKGLWKKAIEEYDIVLDKYKTSEFTRETLYDKGWAYYQLGNLSSGLEAHRRFITSFPDDERAPGVLLKVAQEDLKGGKYENAIKLYGKFLSDYEKDPQRQFAMYQMARAFYEAGRYGEAIRTYDDILEDFPYSEITGNVFYWRAIAYQKNEDWDSAIKDFREAANKGGELAVKASEAVAFSLFQKGDEAAAADAYYAVISESISVHAGMQKSIYVWTAEFYTKEGENEKALEVLMALEKAYPGSADNDVLYLLGENSRLIGKEKEAVKYFDMALEGGVMSPRKERCYLGKGKALAKLGETEEAISVLEKALAGDRDNVTGAWARMSIGDIYSGEGNFAEAAKQYSMVAILYDDKEISPKALFSAAEAFKKAGMDEEAEKLFRELVEKYPGHSLAEKTKREITKTDE